LNIYVGNLPRTTDEEAVRKEFSVHGEVTDVKLIKDRETGQLRGFGFVEMPSKDEALNAIGELNGFELGGRTLVVNEAKPRTNGGYQRNRDQGGYKPRSW